MQNSSWGAICGTGKACKTRQSGDVATALYSLSCLSQWQSENLCLRITYPLAFVLLYCSCFLNTRRLLSRLDQGTLGATSRHPTTITSQGQANYRKAQRSALRWLVAHRDGAHIHTLFFPSDCDIIIPTTEDCIRLQNPSPLVEDVLILVIRSQTEYSFFSHSELFLANNSIPSISHITKGAWLSSGRISPSLHLYVFNPSANNGELSQGSRRRHFVASGKCSYSPRIFWSIHFSSRPATGNSQLSSTYCTCSTIYKIKGHCLCCHTDNFSLCLPQDNTANPTLFYPSPNVSRQANQLTEEEQVKIAQRIGLIQHLPTGSYDGCKKNREYVS